MIDILGQLGAGSDLIEHHIGAITAVIAGAAVFQWRETRLTAERQLRAYVLNSSATLFDGTTMPHAFVDRAGQAGVILTIKNYGQPPAYAVCHEAEIQVAPVCNEGRMSIPRDQHPRSAFTLGPDGSSNSFRWLNRPISPQEQAGIVAGTVAIYAYGRVEYTDAFKRRRWSTYRLRHCGNAWPPVGGSESIGMDFCAEGNDGN